MKKKKSDYVMATRKRATHGHPHDPVARARRMRRALRSTTLPLRVAAEGCGAVSRRVDKVEAPARGT